MTLDIARPEYREALREGAALLARNPSAKPVCLGRGNTDNPPSMSCDSCLLVLASESLSSPSQSAALVCALLDGCGVDVVRLDPRPMTRARGADAVDIVGWGAEDERWHCVDMANVPALVLALLDATDRESALAALREHGR